MEEGEEKIEEKEEMQEEAFPGDSDDFKVSWRAWKVVIGCWIFAATSLGWGLTWGIWQTAFQLRFPDTELSTLATVAGLANFTTTAISFVSGRLGDRFGYKRMIGLGAVVSLLVFIAMAFSSSVLELFLFQGLFYGLAAGISFPLIIALPSQWFYKKRGLATGLAISGSGIGGMAASLIIRILISNFGYKIAYLVYAAVNGFLWIFTWYFLLEDRVLAKTKEKKPWLPSGVWRDGAFYSILISVFIAIFGYLAPFYYITAFTKFLFPYLSDLSAAGPLAVMNCSAALGRVIAGIFSDRYVGPVNSLFLSFFIGGSIQLVMWTVASNLATIYAFSILYGLFGPAFLSLLTPAASKLFDPEGAGLGALTGILLLANAPGQFSGASIAGLVLERAGYKYLAVFSGSCMLLGGVVLLYARFSREPRWLARY